MKQKSRTEYSMMNTSVALLAQVSAILMGFFTRVVFTRTLSEGYVGINGLFTDILNILSLSELGVGTAITYALYGPIAKKDYEKQKILMRLFRLFYRVTAAIVLIAGLLLIPFLDILMKAFGLLTFLHYKNYLYQLLQLELSLAFVQLKIMHLTLQ